MKHGIFLGISFCSFVSYSNMVIKDLVALKDIAIIWPRKTERKEKGLSNLC